MFLFMRLFCRALPTQALKLVISFTVVFSFAQSLLAQSLEEPQATEDEITVNSATGDETWDSTLDEAKEHGVLTENNLEQVDKKGTASLSKFMNLLQELSIHYSLGGSQDLIDGFGVKLKYSTKTEPAFYGKYFSRSDKWEIRPNLDILEILGQDTPAKLGISLGLEVDFNQFFEKYEDALNPLNQYTPLHLPLTSQKAIEMLKPGDLVSFDGEMSVFYGYRDVFKYFSDNLKLVPTVGGIMSGHFRVYVFRADKEKVRLRIGAVRNNPKFIRAEVGFLDLLDLGWGPLTSFITRALKLKSLAEVEIEKYNRDTLLSDFTLDMRDQRVKDAYDNLFSLERQQQALLKTANPFSTDRTLRDNLYVNVERLIELSIDTAKDLEPAVIMNFSGSNFATGKQKKAEGGASIIARAQNEMTSQYNNLKQVLYDIDGVETQRYFVFPSWDEAHKHSSLATLWEESDERYSNIIYEADQDYNIVKFANIGFYHDYTDKKFDQKENARMLRDYEKVLPAKLFAEYEKYLAQNKWLILAKQKKNVRIKSRYFIHDKGLQYAENMRRGEFESRLLAEVQEMDKDVKHLKLVRRYDLHAGCLNRYGYISDREGYHVGPNILRHCRNIENAAQALEEAFDSRRNKNDRNKSFVSLSKNNLFQMLGPGILFDMIPDDKLKEVTYFEITINSSDLKTALAYRYGEAEDRKLYEMIFQIEDIMGGNPPDLRLAGPTETTTTRIYGGNGH
ncbi:MAG: hypothetical protein KDD38_10420 [Bdellovibrionales bacterium]|nr:hypothetical protein [Bdellovibrionales bacterium]